MQRYIIYISLLIFSYTALADISTATTALSNGSFSKAVEEFKQLAEQGNVKAQSNLGYMYYVGEGVPQDYAEAVKWYRKAAAQGDKDAQYNLAVAYAFGEGVKQDYKEAAIWYRRAAEQGHAIAQYSLGISYAYGEGVDQDEKQAAEWFLKSAEQGYERAQVSLGSMFHTGDGIPKNYDKAAFWYRKAADRDNPAAQYNLGTLYRAGKGVPQDYNQAVRWFRMAADQGYAAAQNELASIERALAGATRKIPAPTPAQATAPDSTPPDPVARTTTKANKSPSSIAEVTAPTVTTKTESSVPLVTLKKESLLTLNTLSDEIAKKKALQTKEVPQNDETIIPEQSEEVTHAETIAAEQSETVTGTAVQTEDSNNKPGFFSRLFGSSKDKTKEPGEEIQTVTLSEDPEPEEIVTPYQARTEPETLAVMEEEPITEEQPEELAANTVETEVNEDKPGFFSRLFGPSKDKTKGSGEEIQAVTLSEDPEPKEIVTSYQARTELETLEVMEEDPIAAEQTEEPADITIEAKDRDNKPGFFTRLFGSEAEQTETAALSEGSEEKQEKEQTVVAIEQAEEKPVPVIEKSIAISYAAGEAPAEQQLITVQDDAVAMLDDDPHADLQTGSSGPEFLELPGKDEQLSEPQDNNTEVVDTTEAIAEEQSSDLFSLFGKLFGKDKAGEQAEEVTGKKFPGDEKPVVQTMLETEPDITLEETAETALNTAETRTTAAESTSVYSNVAFETLQTLAVKGDIEAQYKLAVMYYTGNGVKQNYSRAFLWYRRAATQGNVEAQYSLGNMYLMGEGISQNNTEAANWYTQAAEQGHAEAQHNLENLQRIAVNPETEETDPLTTANETETQLIEEPDKKGGFFSKLFSSADKKQVTEEDPGKQEIVDVEPSRETATTETIEEETTANTAKKYYELGIAYAYGEGVAQNHITAVDYFTQAAELGYAPAQYKLGIAYSYGEGIEQNVELATEWYKKAAEQGYSIAQRNLGKMYAKGDGIEQNKPLGLAWYIILAEQGNVMDIHRRDALKKELTESEIEEAERLRQQLSTRIITTNTSS